MSSNPPIKSIPTSVAEPNKHIAAYLHSVRPFTVDFANRGVEYFTRSRAGGDALSEEDWRRDYYDVPSSSRQRRPQINTAVFHHHAHHHHVGGSPHHHHYPHQQHRGSPSLLKRHESVAKPGPLPFTKRYSATRATPYVRRSLDVAPPSSYNPNTPVDKLARKPNETRDRDAIDSEVFGYHLQSALHRAVARTHKRLPALPISPPAEVKPTTPTTDIRRESLRRSVPTKNANAAAAAAAVAAAAGHGVKLDSLQVAIQRPSRLSLPRSGILARGVMSQPVKVSSPYTSHYEIDPTHGMPSSVPQTCVDPPTDLHQYHHPPGSRRLPSYGPTSPYSAEHASGAVPSRSAHWSPWAADSPSSHQRSSRYGIAPSGGNAHWIDEIGSLYGLCGGAEDRTDTWYASPEAQAHQVRPTSLHVDVDKRRYGRPVSAPLPEALYDTIPESAIVFGSHHQASPHRLEASPPSMIHLEPLSPMAGGSGGADGHWGPRSDSHNGGGGHPHHDWSMAPPVHAHGHSWPSNDPVTPVSPSEEVITFGWGPPTPAAAASKSAGFSPLDAYYWPTSAGGASAAKRESSLPPLNTLSLQSPSPFSPYFPSPSDYGREVTHAHMF